MNGFTLDTREFEETLQRVLSQTSRSAPEVLNRAARNIIIKAAQLTPKADSLKIQEKLTDGFVTSKSGKLSKKPKLRPSKMVYLILNAKQRAAGKPGLNNAAMSSAARKFINTRKAASGFTAFAGWNNALLAVGGRGFGNKKQPGFDKSSAAPGYGKAATVGDLSATLVNTAIWAEQIGQAPLQAALDMVAGEMEQHMADKLAAAAEGGR